MDAPKHKILRSVHVWRMDSGHWHLEMGMGMEWEWAFAFENARWILDRELDYRRDTRFRVLEWLSAG